MRKLLLFTLILLSVSCDTYNRLEAVILSELTPTTELVDSLQIPNTPTYELNVAPLIEAMIWVESKGDDSAYCKREEAVGCLQIRPIMLRECNRILELKNSTKRYTLLDRWARDKSIEIFHIVNQYYNKTNSYEAIARSWNGGPTWAQKSNTKKYWRKVHRKLTKLTKENEYSSNRFAQI